MRVAVATPFEAMVTAITVRSVPLAGGHHERSEGGGWENSYPGPVNGRPHPGRECRPAELGATASATWLILRQP